MPCQFALSKVLILSLLSCSLALPPQSRRAADAPFSVSEDKLKAALICPTGSTDPNTVLLVPGTGEKASDFFSKNLGQLLPVNGFPVCFLNTPNLSVGDMQITSEYVAFAIQSLAASTKSQVRVVSHSQGGSDVQWALTFWPSTRPSVSSFVALGPAWQGTQIGSLVTDIRKFLTGKGVASVFQQGAGSNFLKAMAAHGGLTSLVPTTSLYTVTDEIVQPFASGVLPGNMAVNIKLQDICPGRVEGHFGLVVDSISEFFVVQALKANGTSKVSDMTADERSQVCAQILPRFTSVDAVVDFTRDMLISVVSTVITGLGDDTQVSEEPPLKAYAQ